MEIKVLDGQTIFDVVMMVSGSVEGAFELALENGISVTDDLKSGQVLRFSGGVINKKVLEYFRENGVVPATFDNTAFWILANGYWDDCGVWIDDKKFV